MPPVPALLDALPLVPLAVVLAPALPVLVVEMPPVPPEPPEPAALLVLPSSLQEERPASTAAAMQKYVDLDSPRQQDSNFFGKRFIPRLSHKSAASARPKSAARAFLTDRARVE